MEAPSLFATAGTTTAIITVALAIYKAINHTRCKSRCCGQNMEMSVDVEKTTASPNAETAFNIKPSIVTDGNNS
jgi:hypothetical protein